VVLLGKNKVGPNGVEGGSKSYIMKGAKRASKRGLIPTKRQGGNALFPTVQNKNMADNPDRAPHHGVHHMKGTTVKRGEGMGPNIPGYRSKGSL